MRIGARWGLAGRALAGALAIAGVTALSSPVQAAVVNITYLFKADGMDTGTCAGVAYCPTSFGSVHVTGNTDSSLTFTVTLAAGVSFHASNSDSDEVFVLDLTDPGGSGITFSGVTTGGTGFTFSGPTLGTYVPSNGNFPGPYNYAVTCTVTASPGNLCGNTLTFIASGGSTADPLVLGLPLGGSLFSTYHIPFVADLSVAAGTAGLCPGTSACTGLVGTPEPSTWGMMLLGFVGLGFAGYRKARTSRRPLAAA